MKRIILIIFTIVLLLPLNIFAKTCDNDKVIIESISVEKTQGTATEKTEAIINGKTINLDLSMNYVGDKITYKIKIKNDSKDNYEVDKNSITINSNYIHYYLENNNYVIRANSTGEVLLTVEYYKEVPEPLYSSGKYNDSQDLVFMLSTFVNPNTGNIILLIVCFIFFIILGIITLKSGKKKILIFMLSLLFIPVITYAACKIEVNINSNVEIKKAAEFDDGMTINNKMNSLSGDKTIIKGFIRSDVLPDNIKNTVTEDLSVIDTIDLTNYLEEYKNYLIDNNYLIDGYYEMKHNGEKYYCFNDGGEECFSKEEMFEMYTDGNFETLLVRNTDNDQFFVYNSEKDDFELLSEEEFTNQVLRDIVEKNKRREIVNIFSSVNSSFIIYGWYENENIYYYCEDQDVYLNVDSSYMFENLRSLGNISGLINVNTSKVKDMSYMFSSSSVRSLEFIPDFSSWDTSNVENMEWMFGMVEYETFDHALSYANLNLSSWDVSNVKNMNHMFSQIGGGIPTYELNLSGWDTSNVEDMGYMFYDVGSVHNIYGLSDLDVSKVTNMSSMFSGACYSENFTLDLSKWNTSSVNNMSNMFSDTGRAATSWTVGDISDWDTSSVTNMISMFKDAGFNVESFIIDLSKWNTSSVRYMTSMFKNIGYNAAEWSIGDLSNWDTSNVTDMSKMFNSAGPHTTDWNIGDLSNWKTGNVTNMENMFSLAAVDSTSFILDLSNWDTSSVNNMSSMFESTGLHSTVWNIGNLSKWNVSNVDNMSNMFHRSGVDATIWNIGDLSNWNVSKVTNMKYMFYGAGENATEWGIGDLSNWDTSKVTNMYGMFNGAGKNATMWHSIGTLKVYANDITYMFLSCKNARGTINIYSRPSSYDNAFLGAAKSEGSGIVVNYSSRTTNINSIINTKSNDSNVTKGVLLD